MSGALGAADEQTGNVRAGSSCRAFLALAALAAMLVIGFGGFASATTLVPPGNRSAEQPGVPGASTKRTKAPARPFEAKYRKVYALLKNDATLRKKIDAAAGAYGIDPDAHRRRHRRRAHLQCRRL